ncbi:MAG TPA: Ku protein [Candidatus Dormibacteraeota bacterium]
MRAIWSGTISFGMVSIPVRLFTATESHDVRLHLLHRECGARLKNIRWCPVHDRAIPWEDVERGFESAKDRYVPITQEDLDNLPVKTVRSVEISDFVKLEEVDPIYFDKAYYLAPSENGAKAFALLRQALEQTGRAAVAKVAIRDKESLCLVRPYQGMLTMETMFYANEVRSADELATTESSASKVSPRELQMAVSLIENLSNRFDPERYEDDYQAALKKVIDAKLEGVPVPQAPRTKGTKVVDLMEALRASIEATNKGGAPAERRAVAPRPRPAARPRATTQRRRKTA